MLMNLRVPVTAFVLSIIFAFEISAAWPPAPALERVADTYAGEVPKSIRAMPAGNGLWEVTFFFTPAPNSKAVSVAGTFNGWNASASPMQGPRGDGTWSATLEIPPGRHEYKFVVDGTQWLTDPQNPQRVDDLQGGDNSLISLGRAANLNASPARSGDGKIDVIGLEHVPAQPLYFQPLTDGSVKLRYRTFARDVARVFAAVQGGDVAPLTLAKRTAVFDWYEGRVELPAASQRGQLWRASYTFILEDGAGRVSHPDTYSAEFSEGDVFRTPEWARHAIWYQIMLDRFRNGSTDNDPPNAHPWTADWFKAQPYEIAKEREGQSFYNYYVFDRLFGGDLQGAKEKLPYLKELGVNAIYFNPVFIGASHHKYDATNFLHIDPLFGAGDACDYEAIAATEDLNDPSTWKWTKSDKIFLDFLQHAKSMGFRVIIDGVFNHVGTAHPAFQSVLNEKQNSPYADWFDVRNWDPFEYEGWGGFGALPAFRKSADGLASEQVKQHIFNVTRRWMDPNGDGDPSDGIDGWRLDVPNEIPAPFWVEWRKVVKTANPDAYITGEIWDRADMWLDGKHFDAVMNYQFAHAALDWIINKERKITATQVDQRLLELRLAYPEPATYVMQNLYNSHDTDRLASMVRNPDRAYDQGNRIQDNGPHYDNRKPTAEHFKRMRLLALLQMTYVGAPMIYYGDEVGMWGADDPTCRKAMLWKDLEPYEIPDENFVMDDQLAYYRRVIALRNAHPALRIGSFQTLRVHDAYDVWVFHRVSDTEQVLVALNASDRVQTVDVALPDGAPKQWKTVWGGEGTLSVTDNPIDLTIPAVGGIVLHAQN